MLKRLMVSGYKQHELGIFDEKHPGIPIIKKAVRNRLEPMLEEGLEWIIISGQLGVETWTAELIMELQETYPALKYAVITPFLDQEKGWNEAKQEKYEEIVANADYHTSLTKRPYEAPWQFVEKNRFLLRNTDGLLLVYDEEKEGSPKYLKQEAERYAQTSDYKLILITADDLQWVAEEERQGDW